MEEGRVLRFQETGQVYSCNRNTVIELSPTLIEQQMLFITCTNTVKIVDQGALSFWFMPPDPQNAIQVYCIIKP